MISGINLLSNWPTAGATCFFSKLGNAQAGPPAACMVFLFGRTRSLVAPRDPSCDRRFSEMNSFSLGALLFMNARQSAMWIIGIFNGHWRDTLGRVMRGPGEEPCSSSWSRPNGGSSSETRNVLDAIAERQT